jgi:hypothetical protein
MKRKPWRHMSKEEVRKRWLIFKNRRRMEHFKEHALAIKDSDWISMNEREHMIDVLIERIN